MRRSRRTLTRRVIAGDEVDGEVVRSGHYALRCRRTRFSGDIDDNPFIVALMLIFMIGRHGRRGGIWPGAVSVCGGWSISIRGMRMLMAVTSTMVACMTMRAMTMAAQMKVGTGVMFRRVCHRMRMRHGQPLQGQQSYQQTHHKAGHNGSVKVSSLQVYSTSILSSRESSVESTIRLARTGGTSRATTFRAGTAASIARIIVAVLIWGGRPLFMADQAANNSM